MSVEYTLIAHHKSYDSARSTFTLTMHDPTGDELRDGVSQFFSAEGYRVPRDEEIEADLIAAYESRNRAVELLSECISHVDSAEILGRIRDYIDAVDAE